MSENAEAAKAFREIGDLLDLLGERFKPEAYRRAARSIESLTEDLAEVAKRDQLRQIPGVGEAIEEKVREFLRTGSIAYLEKIRAEVPAGVLALMRIEGLGPKTARRFWTDLGVESPEALKAAIDAGKLAGLSGFGPTKIAKIRAALDAATASSTARRPLLDAALLAERLVEALRQGAPVDQIEVAGSYRRRRETVGDLDLLVTSVDPEKVMAVLAAQEGVRVVLRGPTKETIRTPDGLQVDLRVLAPESFGAALQYFTGSKDHNVQTRSLARDRGLKINEYAVMRGDERLPSATELDIYKALDMAWVPPEIREAQGEVELAQAGKLPRLLEREDLIGDPHVHLPPGTRASALEEIAHAAHRAGLSYVGLLPAEEDRDHLAGHGSRRGGPRILLGREVPVGARRSEDGTAEFTVLSGATGDVPASDAPAPVPDGPTWLSHLGADWESAPGPKRVAAWATWALAAGLPIEVNPRPGYEGVEAVTARRFVASGGRLVVSEHGLGPERARALAVGTARRAWVTKEPVLTAGPWPWPAPRAARRAA